MFSTLNCKNFVHSFSTTIPDSQRGSVMVQEKEGVVGLGSGFTT
jgi:hypothetical protein